MSTVTSKTVLVLTTLMVAAFIAIVGYVTYRVFTHPVDIPTSALAGLTTVYALPALAVGLWKWRTDAATEARAAEKAAQIVMKTLNS